MKKNIYTGIFCTILGLCINTPANASLISRGFLDEKLTEMTNATTLQLDTKANQSDIILINTEVDPAIWNDQRESAIKWSVLPVAPIIAELFPDFVDEPYVPESISGTLLNSLKEIDRPGIAGFTNKLLNGWTDENGVLANPGLKNIYGGWTDSDGNFFPGLSTYSIGEANVIKSYDDQNTARVLINGTKATTIDGVDYTGPVYPLWKLSEEVAKIDSIETKIGTLPSGNFPSFPGSDFLFPWLNQPLTYPTSLAELINAIYGDEETIGLLPGIIARFPIDTDGDGDTDVYTGLIPNFRLANDANNLANANATKIGTLPTEIPNMDSTWTRYGFVETPGTPIDLPDTIGGMFAMLFNEDDSYDGLSLRNIMVRILMGFNRIEGLANLTSAYNLVGDSPIVTAVNANTTKIGTLPDGYETVGAALSAIKGIAEEAKAAALAAIPDPKTEGSNGKYVLTVDIVGDNATYRWEPIDRGDTTPTTE